MYKFLYHKNAVKALYKYDRIFKEKIEEEITLFVENKKFSNCLV